MAICELSGKGKMYDHNVSFSQRKTRKVFKPNIQKRTLFINGRKVKLNISAAALRTLKKKGMVETYRKAEDQAAAKAASKKTATKPDAAKKDTAEQDA